MDKKIRTGGGCRHSNWRSAKSGWYNYASDNFGPFGEVGKTEEDERDPYPTCLDISLSTK